MNTQKKLTIVLFSNHWYESPRKAGFHHLADAYSKMGHTIYFVTTGVSWISYFRRDFRTKYPSFMKSRNKLRKIKKDFFSYIHFTPYHPHTLVLPVLNKLTSSFVDRYGSFSLDSIAEVLKKADIVFYESNSSILLLPICKKIALNAKHIYRVSDDLEVLGSTHPQLLHWEKKLARSFDLISSPRMYEKKTAFKNSTFKIHPHGVQKDMFDAVTKSPYKKGINCIFVGLSFIDIKVLEHLVSSFQDVNFHFIGAKNSAFNGSNTILYGEMDFKKTLPYIKFADVGLFAPAPAKSHENSLVGCLKELQYRYCGLPMISSIYQQIPGEKVFYYTPGDKGSYVNALSSALNSGRDMNSKNKIKDWMQVASSILKSL